MRQLLQRRRLGNDLEQRRWQATEYSGKRGRRRSEDARAKGRGRREVASRSASAMRAKLGRGHRIQLAAAPAAAATAAAGSSARTAASGRGSAARGGHASACGRQHGLAEHLHRLGQLVDLRVQVRIARAAAAAAAVAPRHGAAAVGWLSCPTRRPAARSSRRARRALRSARGSGGNAHRRDGAAAHDAHAPAAAGLHATAGTRARMRWRRKLSLRRVAAILITADVRSSSVSIRSGHRTHGSAAR